MFVPNLIFALTDCLGSNSTLRTLGLSNNKVKDEGGLALAVAVRATHTLEALDLSINFGLSGDVRRALRDASESNTIITVLM